MIACILTGIICLVLGATIGIIVTNYVKSRNMGKFMESEYRLGRAKGHEEGYDKIFRDLFGNDSEKLKQIYEKSKKKYPDNTATNAISRTIEIGRAVLEAEKVSDSDEPYNES